MEPLTKTPTPRTNAIQRITDYLLSGGLFNPELAIHDNVRDLLIDCRTELAEKTNEVARLRGLLKDHAIFLRKNGFDRQADDLMRFAPAPEKTLDGVTMNEWYGGFAKIEKTEEK